MTDEKVLLTKDMILKGRDRIVNIFIQELGGEVRIRPLTEEAWAEIQSVGFGKSEMVSSATFDKDGNIDRKETAKNVKMKFSMEQLSKGNFMQNVIALKYGLVEEWTEEEIKSISPPGIIIKIAEEIYKISKISKADLEEINFFRKE